VAHPPFVTSIGLVIGLESATAPAGTIVSGLLIIAIADNLSDSLSIHMYQESERLDARAVLRTTLANFVARLLVALSFVMIVIVFPALYAGLAAIAWGFALLTSLSYVLARVRGVSPLAEIGKHVTAILVIFSSRLIGTWILHHLSTSDAYGNLPPCTQRGERPPS
jgi:vacuolar iron transporter family protein